MNAVKIGLISAFMAIASLFFVVWSVQIATVIHVFSWVLCFAAVIIKRQQSKVK